MDTCASSASLLRLPEWAKGVYALEELQVLVGQKDSDKDCLELGEFISELEAIA